LSVQISLWGHLAGICEPVHTLVKLFRRGLHRRHQIRHLSSDTISLLSILAARARVKILQHWPLICMMPLMAYISEVASAANGGSGSVTVPLEPAQKPTVDARCLWCDRTFSSRTTGGSMQKFCCTGHRQQFWIAARRWTMRAIEAGLLSVDCLKASHTSVHAA
jgi:hypothetical protein